MPSTSSNVTHLYLSTRFVLIAILTTFGLVMLLNTPANAAPSIRAPKNVVEYGKTVVLKGKAPAGTRALELLERPYPYRSERVIKRTRPRANGKYSIRVRPEMNTRYRVRVRGESQAGKAVRIWVDPANSFKLRTVADGSKAAVRWTLRWSPKLKQKHFRRVRVSYYWAKRGSPHFRLMKKSPGRVVAPGRFLSKTVFGIPVGRYNYQVASCVQVPPYGKDTGLGKPTPKKAACPSKGFKRRSKAWYNPFR